MQEHVRRCHAPEEPPKEERAGMKLAKPYVPSKEPECHYCLYNCGRTFKTNAELMAHNMTCPKKGKVDFFGGAKRGADKPRPTQGSDGSNDKCCDDCIRDCGLRCW